jgi:hypothetical protein
VEVGLRALEVPQIHRPVEVGEAQGEQQGEQQDTQSVVLNIRSVLVDNQLQVDSQLQEDSQLQVDTQ